jgi:hypothetical protein
VKDGATLDSHPAGGPDLTSATECPMSGFSDMGNHELQPVFLFAVPVRLLRPGGSWRIRASLCGNETYLGSSGGISGPTTVIVMTLDFTSGSLFSTFPAVPGRWLSPQIGRET